MNGSAAQRKSGTFALSRWLSGHPGLCHGQALFVFVNGFISIGILAGLAMMSHTPLIFPSLGPTAFLLFFAPLSAAACPRNTLLGHAIGIVCGYGALWLVGLQDVPSAMLEGVHARRVLAAALSLASTGAVMILLRTVHPPAGATTLIISLGIIKEPFHLLAIEMAVALMIVQALFINRWAGVAYPLWAGRSGAAAHQGSRDRSRTMA
jgi:CBS domain-containing membrane protein